MLKGYMVRERLGTLGLDHGRRKDFSQGENIGFYEE